MGERELAVGMAHYALRTLECSQQEADGAVDAVRRGLAADPRTSIG
jgi:hypothetical protein